MFGLKSILYIYPKNRRLYFLTNNSNNVKSLKIEGCEDIPNVPFWATSSFFLKAKEIYKKVRPYNSLRQIVRKKIILIIFPPDISGAEKIFLRDFCEQMGAREIYMSPENIAVFTPGKIQSCFNICDTGRNYVLSYLSGTYDKENAAEIIQIVDKDQLSEEKIRQILSKKFPSKINSLPLFFLGKPSIKFSKINVQFIKYENVLENLVMIINSEKEIKSVRLSYDPSFKSASKLESSQNSITRFKIG